MVERLDRLGPGRMLPRLRVPVALKVAIASRPPANIALQARHDVGQFRAPRAPLYALVAEIA